MYARVAWLFWLVSQTTQRQASGRASALAQGAGSIAGLLVHVRAHHARNGARDEATQPSMPRLLPWSDGLDARAAIGRLYLEHMKVLSY